MRILSIDGGGIRGIMSILMLEDIEKRIGKPIHEVFDLFCGTSTGAIIGLSLNATKDDIKPIYGVNDLFEFYTNEMTTIFTHKFKVFRSLKKLIRPEFSNEKLKDVLGGSFGHLKMSDTLKPIVVSSYDVFNDTPIFFKSRKSKLVTELNVFMRDAAIGSVSAPTYFRPHTFTYDGIPVSCVDGGIYINNPSMAGVAEACKNHNVGLNDIKLLSLGNGFTHKRTLPSQSNKWGVIQWINPLIKYMMYGNMEVVDYEVRSILKPENYLRINLELDTRYSEMSDTRIETIDYLINLVYDYIESYEYQKQIDGFIESLDL